ncbi:MAG: prepilin peptidase [Dermatophilaceae bacterium]
MNAVVLGAAGAGGGLALGVLLARALSRRGYRYDDERDLPLRSVRWVPVAVAVAAAVVAAGQFGPRPTLGGVLLAFVPFLVGLAAIDIDTHRLPDRFVRPGIVAALLGVALVAAVERTADPLVAGVLAGLALGAFYLANVVLGELVGSGAGMGLGDAKLAVVLGLLLGPLSWAHVVVATVLAFVTAGAHGLWLVLARGGTRRTHLAFGPHLVVGTILVIGAPGALAMSRAAG